MGNGIAIIGGGASGLMAAVTAAEKGKRVTVLEATDRVGKKLLATGSGRCNITNTDCSRSHYHGSWADTASELIADFSPSDTLSFFERLGLVATVEDGGKVYPISGTASSVLDVLRLACNRLGVNVVTGFKAVSVRKHNGTLAVKAADGREFVAERVIVATGGMAGSKFGCDGSGYKLLGGHKCSRLLPSLVQLKTDNRELRSLSGLRTEARVKACGQVAEGEVLFTDFGLSGPAIFEVSRLCAIACAEGKHVILELDFMPQISEDALTELLKKRCSEFPERTMEDFLIGLFHRRIGFAIVKSAGITPLSIQCGTLTEAQVLSLVANIKHLKTEISGTLSWQNAQVTSGGLETDGFDVRTLESERLRGVYFCGEVLDLDGDCGGFNLQWAWTSGRLAALSASESIDNNVY